MIGCPKDGASESRTVRGIDLRHTLLAEVLANLLRHLLGQLGPGVVHDQHDRAHLQRRVEVPLDQVDVAQELAQTLQGVVLALDGDQHLARPRPGR